jgi:hypothetical protein
VSDPAIYVITEPEGSKAYFYKWSGPAVPCDMFWGYTTARAFIESHREVDRLIESYFYSGMVILNLPRKELALWSTPLAYCPILRKIYASRAARPAAARDLRRAKADDHRSSRQNLAATGKRIRSQPCQAGRCPLVGQSGV